MAFTLLHSFRWVENVGLRLNKMLAGSFGLVSVLKLEHSAACGSERHDKC